MLIGLKILKTQHPFKNRNLYTMTTKTMFDDLAYPEIRIEARRLSWALARTLNAQVGTSGFIYSQPIKAYTQALEWLGGVISDDWTDLQSIVEEVQAMPTLALTDELQGGLWNHFVGFVIDQARENNIAFESREPAITHIPTLEEIKASFQTLGLENGFIHSKSGLFGRKTWQLN